MNIQSCAIVNATEFLNTYIFNSGETNGQYKTAINKRAAKGVNEEVVEEDKEEGASLFWKEIRWPLSQATIESFAKFFKDNDDNLDTAQAALKSVASIGFDLTRSGYLEDYISSTTPFQEYKLKSLHQTQRQLIDVQTTFKNFRESGNAVTTVDQNNHEKFVGVLTEIIQKEGRPVLTPPEFLKCYTAMLDDVVARATEVMAWSADSKPKTKPIKRKKVMNADA